MGYMLVPNNKDLETFELGAYSFPILLEACNYLWPCIHQGPQWYCVFDADERMGEGGYPKLLTNDGFPVTAEEANIMGRIAQNVVLIQRSLPDDHKSQDVRSKAAFTKDDILEGLIRGMFGGENHWPVKIREDFVKKFEAFAVWAKASEGFEIW